MLGVLYHHAKFGGDRTSQFTCHYSEQKLSFFVCVFVGVSIMHRLCALFCHEDIEYRNDFDTVG